LSLLPSLLDKIHPNIKAGYGEFALFEIGKAHIKGRVDEADGLPQEYERLALVYAADDKAASNREGAPYYQALRQLTHVMAGLGLDGKFKVDILAENETDTAAVYFQPGRAATISVDNQIVGRIGEYRPSVRKAFKLPAFSAGFELGLSAIMPYGKPHVSYIPLSRYPKVDQDLCLKVAAGVTYYQVYQAILAQLVQLQPERTQVKLSPVDIYQRSDDPAHKQITMRLSIASYNTTLRDSEVAKLIDAIAQGASQTLPAERV
jgi:phenylalanyl-tRNA synthetase beta subunit